MYDLWTLSINCSCTNLKHDLFMYKQKAWRAHAGTWSMTYPCMILGRAYVQSLIVWARLPNLWTLCTTCLWTNLAVSATLRHGWFLSMTCLISTTAEQSNNWQPASYGRQMHTYKYTSSISQHPHTLNMHLSPGAYIQTLFTWLSTMCLCISVSTLAIVQLAIKAFFKAKVFRIMDNKNSLTVPEISIFIWSCFLPEPTKS